jgi:methylenetetrahydrofolate reductase (NADPH)
MAQVQRFCKMCEATLPFLLDERLQHSEEADQPAVGSKWAKEQVQDLLDGGAPGFHLYALNQSAASVEILEGIKKA